jgi:hypothetical protein
MFFLIAVSKRSFFVDRSVDGNMKHPGKKPCFASVVGIDLFEYIHEDFLEDIGRFLRLRDNFCYHFEQCAAIIII